MSVRLGLFGRGRLGGAIAEELAAQLTPGSEPQDLELAWQLGRGDSPLADVDVAIDASLTEAVAGHVDWALERGVPLVIAATGWQIDDLEDRVGERGAVLLAPNGSLAVALMARLARVLGAFAAGRDAGGWLLDHHHAGKKDRPSGTALRLAEAYELGAGRPPDVASLRAGHELGCHALGIDAPGEVIELRHRVRSRATFARGLLDAARWLHGRWRDGGRGVFTMDEVAADRLDPLFRFDPAQGRFSA